MSFLQKIVSIFKWFLSLFVGAKGTNVMSPNLVSIVTSGSSCGFVPSSLKVGSGAEVTFKNQTEKTVGLMFSNQNIFDMDYLPLPPGQAEVLYVKAGEGGDVRISVRCDINATKVTMTVAPTIIVNRN